jgi:hypothetical protein
MLCNKGRRNSDHCVVIVEGEWGENCCVTQVVELDIIMKK